MDQKLSVGILDFGYRGKMQAGKLLQDCIDYVLQADNLGFPHYWMGEHHGAGKGWSSPEMLLPVLAGMTNNIHIGIAGILLRHYRPYQVALNYKLLSTLFPGRIDLGLANGAIEEATAVRLGFLPAQVGLTGSQLFQQLTTELMDCFDRNKNQEKFGLTLAPDNDNRPAVWRLSRSFSSFDECLAGGLNLCVSTFHKEASADCPKEKLLAFKEQFYSMHHRYPRINIAMAGIYTRNKQTVKQLENVYKNGAVSNFAVIGDMDVFREKLLHYHELLGVSEFTFLDLASSPRERFKTLEQLAELNVMASVNTSSI
ncbi:MAG: LLM class flavin-dependent oxidoreductase [Niastella sp.]|nr:LLM class flavin-dependent oxidoreductase [Niastella sp.]